MDATRDQIWAILTDPVRLARLTPMVRSITDDGRGHWRWQLAGIDVLGSSLTPSFTVAMEFVENERIDFTPAPPKGLSERAAVTGWYVLSDPPAGTSGVALATSLEIALELPLPRVSRPAVESAMRRVVGGMGTQFSKNLLRELQA